MKKSIFWGGGVVGLVLISLIGPLVINFGKSGRESKINHQDYSFLSKAAIVAKIAKDFPLPQTLILTGEKKEWPIDSEAVELKIEAEKTASNLLFRRLKGGWGRYVRDFFRPKYFDLEVSYDQGKLEAVAGKIADEINIPFIPAELTIEGKKRAIKYKAGQVGKEVDRQKLERLIVEAVINYQTEAKIRVPIKTRGDLPTDEQVRQASEKAAKLRGKSLTLSTPDTRIYLDETTLIHWLGFDLNCQQEKIDLYVDTLASSVKKDPVDAVFRFENNKVEDFRSSEQGYLVESTETKRLICQKFEELFESEGRQTISSELPLSYIEAKIKTSEVNDLGIKELLGRGASSFRHSTVGRNHNIEKGASIINRILVAPGETFSFIENLGEVTIASGFKKAYIIRQGKTELDVGGGICQVSTTFFRAMLDAGLDILERQAHAYRVSYYEEDSKPGFDATVFMPKPDLRFTNDTGHYVLIQSRYDGKNKKLTYEIFGSSDGRKVEISNYRQWDYRPPPPDVYIDDPTLPSGTVVQDEHRVSGLKTSFQWKVSRGEEVIHQKTFISDFVPWAAVYRRGTNKQP